jgi:hypothetical protein
VLGLVPTAAVNRGLLMAACGENLGDKERMLGPGLDNGGSLQHVRGEAFEPRVRRRADPLPRRDDFVARSQG